MTANDPLTGPFPTGRELCDSSKMPEYAIPVAAEGTAPSLATQLRQEGMNR